MDNVLDTLGESGPLSPLTSTVHDEDFATLGEPPTSSVEAAHLNSDGEEGHLGTSHDDDDVENHVNIVSGDIAGEDEELHQVQGLEAVVTESDDNDQTQNLGDDCTQASLEESGVLGGVNHLVHAAEQEGILLTTDADGNLAVPVSAEHVIRLLMQTSDGNVVAANASMETIKLSMPGLMTTADGGEITQTVQAVTLLDGTTTLIEAPKQEIEADTESQGLPKFVEGQTIKLEDGTTAVLRATPQEALNEGLQAIQLEDGSTAFISHTNVEGLLTTGVSQLDTSGLNLDQLATQTMLGASEKGNGEKSLVIGDKAYKCLYEDCGRLYTTHHHLKVHKRSHTWDRPFMCEFPNCGKAFSTGYGLKSHNRVHTGEKPYPCPEAGCEKAFKTSGDLQKHVHKRSHTGDRPFMCEFPNCGKAFATGYGLKSHNRVHTGEKPYPCPEAGCEKAFKTSGDLQKHVRTHTGERPFKCPFEGCTRSFTTSNIRKVHIRTHTGERPYICDMEGCGRAFASATNYKNHIRIHTGEKPYVCTVLGCGKRFTEYSSLYKHHVVHTHTKPYTCSHCGKTYRQTSTLAMHKRTAHGEDAPPEMLNVVQDSELSLSGSDSGEPLAKKRLIKDEVPQEDNAGENLVVSNAEGSQVNCHGMVLLASPVGNPEALAVGADGSSQIASLVALQNPGHLSLQDLQQSGISGLTSLSLGESGQQVLVVTDPSQLEALQQLAAQHLETMVPVHDGSNQDQGSQEEHGSEGMSGS